MTGQSLKSISALSDKDLYCLCHKHGSDTLLARRKFEGLLPEVYKRKLYEKKGFSSIFHFAAVLAGLSEKQVRRVVNVERKLADKPALHSLLVNGEVSVNKLARVVSVATPENQETLANQAKLLSNRALETLVRDEKSVHVHTSELHISEEIKGRLAEMREKGKIQRPEFRPLAGAPHQDCQSRSRDDRRRRPRHGHPDRNPRAAQGRAYRPIPARHSAILFHPHWQPEIPDRCYRLPVSFHH